ncbi:MAG: Rad52/Rad22 family DNA repair protein [Acidimicrobiales bacterium]
MEKFPPKHIERTDKRKTKKAYDTVGVKYQAVVDRMNEVLGVDGWSMEAVLLREAEGTYTKGTPWYEVTVKVILSLTSGATRVAAGGHKSITYPDAYKGAITNGLKKCAALFGVAHQVYLDEIDDDNEPVDDTPPPPNVSPARVRQLMQKTETLLKEAGMDAETISASIDFIKTSNAPEEAFKQVKAKLEEKTNGKSE